MESNNSDGIYGVLTVHMVWPTAHSRHVHGVQPGCSTALLYDWGRITSLLCLSVQMHKAQTLAEIYLRVTQ